VVDGKQVKSKLGVKVEALLFDLDGTLVDSMKVILRALNSVLSKRGLSSFTAMELCEVSGIPLRKFLSSRFPNIGRDLVDICVNEFYTLYLQTSLEECKLFPPVKEVLKQLRSRDIKLGLVTTTPRKLVDRDLERFGLRKFFEVVVTGDDVQAHKPAPEAVLKAISELGLKSRDGCAIVGDSPHDISAGKAAGIITIAITTGLCSRKRLARENPNFIIESMSELPKIVNNVVLEVYEKLRSHFGSQGWWQAKSSFEVAVGAILTQRANWANVEKAVKNLEENKLLTPHALAYVDVKEVEKLVRPTGFFHRKAARIQNLSRYLIEHFNGNFNEFLNRDTVEVRNELLSLDGIGAETADSILLYAGDRPVFPVDAYTIRLCQRFGLSPEKRYETVRAYFEANLPTNLEVYKEFHALIVQLGKRFCKVKPLCEGCPLSDQCLFSLARNVERLFNIGYAGKKFGDFINILKANEIDILSDVRRFPTSKYPEFRKEFLESELPRHGIGYIHLAKLGGFRGGYGEYMRTEGFLEGIRELLKLARGKKVCLMCKENQAQYCHRRFILSYLEKLGVETINL
jgi:endonuclease-3 related protein